MHFHSHIRQFGDFSQETGISFGDDQPEFIPEIKHISQQINSRSLVLYTIKEVHQAPFLCTSMFYGTGTKMRIGKEINVLHEF